MSPALFAGSDDGQASPGPHPSYIQVAKPFIFEWKIEECLTTTGANEVREDNFRIQGVAWIDSVRKALQLPVRTFNTAVVYYHKFRLVHADNEYSYLDAAGAALFTACKIEDTLKKSKDILCAAHNLKVSPAEYLSSDDAAFESHAKTLIGLERLILEASGFDFRNRYPQKVLIKLAKGFNVDRQTVGKSAYIMSMDIYRTFAPLKQTSSTMAFACLELSARILDELESLRRVGSIDYRKWSTSREEVMDLYTHHRMATAIGPQHSLDTFIAIRITLNQEASSKNIPRFTKWPKSKPATNGATISIDRQKGTDCQKTGDGNLTSSPMGPTSATGARGRAGERGRDGTVRFMLDAERAKDEKEVVARYFKVEEEEVEIEVERSLTTLPTCKLINKWVHSTAERTLSRKS
ncbi:MAG: RNA polymerase II C-terminal domain kinase beta subunit [Sclerophora amabilis]|nr:MAG: RNA polymerase II C-terminal domain kinase beta subunit [Sclerophora amabilis]